MCHSHQPPKNTSHTSPFRRRGERTAPRADGRRNVHAERESRSYGATPATRVDSRHNTDGSRPPRPLHYHNATTCTRRRHTRTHAQTHAHRSRLLTPHTFLHIYYQSHTHKERLEFHDKNGPVQCAYHPHGNPNFRSLFCLLHKVVITLPAVGS